MTRDKKHVVKNKKQLPRADTRQHTQPEESVTPRTRVTFRLPAQAAPDASSVAVAGTFNDWSVDRHPMTRQKNRDFLLTLELEAGKQYEFRFVIDGVRWENAWDADGYVWNDYAQCENSRVIA